MNSAVNGVIAAALHALDARQSSTPPDARIDGLIAERMRELEAVK